MCLMTNSVQEQLQTSSFYTEEGLMETELTAAAGHTC